MIYDPFMGIGNTAIAAHYLDVKYVGTDIDEKYINHAMERLMEIKKKDHQTNEIER